MYLNSIGHDEGLSYFVPYFELYSRSDASLQTETIQVFD